jgi:ubiquinone biosynthesis protein COQ4
MEKPTQSDQSPPIRTMEYRRAWRALQGLIADSQRTDLAFEVIDALAGNSFERSFQKFCRHPDGQRLLAERPSLLATLSDRDRLHDLPEGSFGQAYLRFMETADLSAEGLVEAEAVAAQRAPHAPPPDPDREFFGDRMRDMHDLWHVLTGYGMDEAGEAAVLAFNLGQVPSPGIALIVLASAVIGPKDLRCTWQRYVLQAWNRGRQSGWLPAAAYEQLLPLPLDDVRRLLRLVPADIAHPAGILVGSRSGPAKEWAMSPAGR